MRVRFGAGCLGSLADEIDYHGFHRVMVLSTPGRNDLATVVSDQLGGRSIGVYPHAQMHVPVDVAKEAASMVRSSGADACVAVGGGSTIGLGKWIALAESVPFIAVPTTYSGSEMTPLWGTTEQGRKSTDRDVRVLPVGVIYDPHLTLSLPFEITLTSAINAIAHSVEALYALNASPIISLLAEDSIKTMTSTLPHVRQHPYELSCRADMQRAAWLAGVCLGATTMGLHHRLCHTLGGALDLPHAPTHTVLLPYVIAYNFSCLQAWSRQALTRAFGSENPALALRDLISRLGGPSNLASLGARVDDVPRVVQAALAAPYPNPRTPDQPSLTGLLTAAIDGSVPPTII
jgi:maleylacetate reductase